uniref:Rab9 effector protein with kelch motifs n=1 Tax=Osmerus mordax TaxID=8014 RepID=C1BJY1_OSMMO|nr:Tip elongation aberrant protein 1 [Osmerus mordax]
MDILPVLEHEDRPQEGLWYSLIPRGGGPGVSVGHTCMFIPSEGEGKGSVLIVGGANPNGSFSESHVLNLDSFEWRLQDWKGLSARYEHCSFVTDSCPQSLWVFAGAEQNGNRNCIQNLQLRDGAALWKCVEAQGSSPSPRTYHTTTACIGDRLYVFSGGETGATPVSDAKLHVFDTVSSTWSQPDTQGSCPSPRHGHVVVAVGSKLYVHGGMAGEKLYSDMYSLDTVSMTWEKILVKGDPPPALAAHSAVTLQRSIYVFGGMTSEGASNAMHRFDCELGQWILMRFESDLPPSRLDHSMCVVPWRVKAEGSGDAGQAQGEPDTIQLAFVFAGMDTQGVIHSDCVGTLLS